MSEIQEHEAVKFKPSKQLHASVSLPWPDDVRRVRVCLPGKQPMVSYNGRPGTVDASQMGYVSYLTYRLSKHGGVALKLGYTDFWRSDGVAPSTRLHFFADPSMPLKSFKMRAAHVHMADDDFNHQCFHPDFDLAESPGSKPAWNDVDPNNPDIPPCEQQDLNGSPNPPGPTTKSGGDVGNCLPIFVTD
jgi:hypothetical protein